MRDAPAALYRDWRVTEQLTRERKTDLMATLLKAIGRLSACNAACYDAHGAECHCVCLGANHGAGYSRAAENVRRMAEARGQTSLAWIPAPRPMPAPTSPLPRLRYMTAEEEAEADREEMEQRRQDDAAAADAPEPAPAFRLRP
jgi:hypothetical protein